MLRKRAVVVLLLVGLLSPVGWAFLRESRTAPHMTTATKKFLKKLDKKQRAIAQMPYNTPQRVDWHFIPKDERKGLQIKYMNQKQRAAAHALLKTALSQIGYDATKKIMHLEALIHALEGGKGSNIRDVERYYFTIFGKPGADNRWGLSFEGHHVSLNFVIQGNEVISSTPQFFAANPGVVKNDNSLGIEIGTRVLAGEELIAFQLVRSLDSDQQALAIIAEKAPREIRAAGEAQPPNEPPAGLPVAQMNQEQHNILRELLSAYLDKMPSDIATERTTAIKKAGFDQIHFAWAGSKDEGIGHYYRVQGPTFLIEFVNTQPDSAGNPVNHIHCVWRDMSGDFAIPIDKT